MLKVRFWTAVALSVACVGTINSRTYGQSVVGWWNFDNAFDLGADTVSGNNLTAVGTPAYEPTGAVGGALSLNGLDAALTGDPFSAVPSGAAPYSISAWIKPDSFTNQLGRPTGIVGWGNYGTAREVNGFRLGGTNDLVNYWWGADLSASAGDTNLSDGSWHHVATSFDGTTRRLFVNGTEIGRDLPGTNNAAATNFYIGKTCHGCSFGEEFFDGLIDEVSIYDYGLSQLDALSLASGTSPADLVHIDDPPPPAPPAPKLVGLWRFDDPLNLGHDSSPSGNTLTPQGGAAYEPAGVIGGAVSLDGIDDMLDSPGGFPANVPAGDDTYSITAWIRADATGARGIVGWGAYGSGGGRDTNALRVHEDNGFRHYWWGGDLDAPDSAVAALGTDLDNGSWNHIAAVFDGETRTLYLNGIELVSDTPGSNNAQPINFAIGRTAAQFNEFFDGALDDVAIFDGALTQQQVLYALQGDFAAIPEPSAVALVACGLLGLLGCRRRRSA